jgi:polyisoprenoid-binding protein YceI
MSVLEHRAQVVPTGTWRADRVHSTLEFAVRHMVVATFRGRLRDFDAVLTADEAGGGVLEGTGDVASVATEEPNLDAHLASPDFLDGERHPQVRFRSSSFVREGADDVLVQGELTIRGVTRPVVLHGTIAGPAVAIDGSERLGLELTTTIDRHDFGVNWNAPLPKGGFAVGDEVRLSAHLELVREG